MKSFVLAVFVALCFGQNAFAQLGLGIGSNNLANKVSGNSVVSNNIAIGNYGGSDAKSLASKIGNSLTSNIGNLASNIGSNLAANIGKSINSGSANVNGLGGNVASTAFGNSGAGLAGSVGTNLAGSVGTGLSANKFTNNFVGGNVGSGSISLGSVPVSGISNFKVGEIEFVSDASANTGYTGDLPIIGYVTFEGYIPAEGTVSVAKDCGCTS